MYAGKITIGVRSRTEEMKEMKLYASNEDLGMAVIKVMAE